MSKAKKILSLSKSIARNSFGLRSNEKIVLVLNYHRIGEVNNQNPFHRLHTVGLNTFRNEISLLNKIGKIMRKHIYPKISTTKTYESSSACVMIMLPNKS